MLGCSRQMLFLAQTHSLDTSFRDLRGDDLGLDNPTRSSEKEILPLPHRRSSSPQRLKILFVLQQNAGVRNRTAFDFNVVEHLLPTE